jgi:hypothetical protein
MVEASGFRCRISGVRLSEVRGSPVKFAQLVFFEEFNPSTICWSYGTSGAGRGSGVGSQVQLRDLLLLSILYSAMSRKSIRRKYEIGS